MSAPVATSAAPPAAGSSPATPRPRLLLLDGHSLAYRAFFALPVENFSTTTGQPTNAVYGFTSMLINILRDEQPTHLAVAFDVSRKTFRSEIFADYKANRSESPTDFRGQVSLVQEVLGALHVPVLTAENYEADDVIATLTVQAVEQGMDVLIGTGDRDALQLVNEHVTVLYPRKGVSDLTRFTPEEVETKYGLTPAQYPDYAALRGDPSDNLPSIPSVGEKTAAKWIREYGSLDALVDQVDTVKGKVGEKLREHLSSVMQNRRLTELDRSVPLPLGPADLAVQAWDRNEVHTLFDNLQFRVLRDRLFATLTSAEPEVEGGFDVAIDSRARRRPGRLAGRARPHRAHRADLPRLVGPRHRDARRPRAGRGRRARDVRRRRPGAGRRRRAGAGRLARRPVRGEGRARGQGPAAGDLGARLGAGRRDQRHRAGRLPGDARAALVRPRRPGGPVPAPRAQGRRRRGGAADPRRARPVGGRRRRRGRAGRPAEVHRGQGPRRRPGADARAAQRRPRCSPSWSCRSPGCWPPWRRGASPPTSTTCASCSASSPRASPPPRPSATPSSGAR